MQLEMMLPSVDAVWTDAVCVSVASGDMKDTQKQDATDVKDEQPSAEMKADAKSESDNKDGVTKMDTIPASMAVTSNEPAAGDHWQLDGAMRSGDALGLL